MVRDVGTVIFRESTLDTQAHPMSEERKSCAAGAIKCGYGG